ncbi:MAG: hypothetical protein ABI843_12655 [Dokdonella sp.]
MNHPVLPNAPLVETQHAPEFELVVDWKQMSAADAAAVRTFWLEERAIVVEGAIAKRLLEVVMHARTADGRIAAVCTAALATPPALGQPVYYWRIFVGSAWRATKLIRTLLNRSCALLGEFAKANDYPGIGILLELQNTRFGETLRRPVWSNPNFVYLGSAAGGREMRIHYFPDVQLK